MVTELGFHERRDLPRTKRRDGVGEGLDHVFTTERAEVSATLCRTRIAAVLLRHRGKVRGRELCAHTFRLLAHRVLLLLRGAAGQGKEDVLRDEQAAGRLVVRRLGSGVCLERLALVLHEAAEARLRGETRCRSVDQFRVLQRITARRREAEQLIVDPDISDDHRRLAIHRDLERRIAQQVAQPIDGQRGRRRPRGR